MYDGSYCSYSCQPGFYYLGTSSYTCGRTGRYVTNGGCRALSPVMASPQQFTVKEFAPINTQILPPVSAVVQSLAVPVTFAINSQGPEPYNNTFSIGLCSGFLIVQAPQNLDYSLLPPANPLWVNVSAIANQDPATAVWGIMNVTLVWVPKPPVFNLSVMGAYSVAEGTPGPLSPPAAATDPQQLGLTYAITFTSFPGAFSIDPSTGVLTQLPGLSFLAVLAVSGAPATVSLQVQATEVDGTGLSAVAPISIAILARPTPPFIPPDQVLRIDEYQTFAGSSVGGISATATYAAISNYTAISIPTRQVASTATLATAFAIDAPSGAVTWSASVYYGIDVPIYTWNGYAVRRRASCLCAPPTYSLSFHCCCRSRTSSPSTSRSATSRGSAPWARPRSSWRPT